MPEHPAAAEPRRPRQAYLSPEDSLKTALLRRQVWPGVPDDPARLARMLQDLQAQHVRRLADWAYRPRARGL